MLECLTGLEWSLLIDIKIFLIGLILWAAGVKVKRYKYWVALLMLIIVVHL